MKPIPDDYFDPPTGERLRSLCSSMLFEKYKDGWRYPRQETSAPSSSNNPHILDGGKERALHDIMVSSTFGRHPLYGPGHILRTNGQIAMFWDGETVWIVEHQNVIFERVVLNTATAPQRREVSARSPKVTLSLALEMLKNLSQKPL
jgi:hypothetical protein